MRLSRQDWRGPKAGWAADSDGHWEIEVAESGDYKFTVLSRSEFTGGGFVAKWNTRRRGRHGTGSEVGPVKPVKSKSFRVALLQGNEAAGVEPG